MKEGIAGEINTFGESKYTDDFRILFRKIPWRDRTQEVREEAKGSKSM